MVINGDCREELKDLIAQGVQVDSIVTDPPYEMGFMNKGWDRTGIAYSKELWQLCLQALKPGGHLLAFGGARTYHRMASAIEDAGFEIRDQIMWLYGQGFPKSLDISKAIDKAAGAEREVVGLGQFASRRPRPTSETNIEGAEYGFGAGHTLTAAATDAAKQWQGFGTALKPAHEPLVLARKPLDEKTIAANVLKHGTGAINIDGCRVDALKEDVEAVAKKENRACLDKKQGSIYVRPNALTHDISKGRFPANVIHDGSDEIEAEFAKYGEKKTGDTKPYISKSDGFLQGCKGKRTGTFKGDTGTASRFFYCAKASPSERNGSKHPTIKPIALMRYLCRLITPPGGTVLDPFAGTGTTGQAAAEEGFNYILIEREAEYIGDINKRIKTA